MPDVWTDEQLPAVAVDIARRLLVQRLTGCNDFSTRRFFPRVHEFSDFLLSACGRRTYELVGRHVALDSVSSVLRRRPPLAYGVLPDLLSHFLEQATATCSTIAGQPPPIESLDDGKLSVVHVCISTDGIALTPALGYVPSLGFLGLTAKGLELLGSVDTKAALEKIAGMSQQELHDFCKKTGALVRNGMATMCRRSDNSCQSLVALHLTGNGGSALDFLREMKELLTLLRGQCSACLEESIPCIRRCDNACTNYCRGCHACDHCAAKGRTCKRITIDTLSMDCASVQWSAMQTEGATQELELNAGFIPDVGHVVRIRGLMDKEILDLGILLLLVTQEPALPRSKTRWMV